MKIILKTPIEQADYCKGAIQMIAENQNDAYELGEISVKMDFDNIEYTRNLTDSNRIWLRIPLNKRLL